MFPPQTRGEKVAVQGNGCWEQLDALSVGPEVVCVISASRTQISDSRAQIACYAIAAFDLAHPSPCCIGSVTGSPSGPQKPLRAHLAGLLTLLSLTQGVAKVVLSDKSVCTGWSKPSPPVHPDLWGLLNSMFQEYISNNSAVARLPMLPRFTFASAGAKRVCVCVKACF